MVVCIYSKALNIYTRFNHNPRFIPAGTADEIITLQVSRK